MQGTLEYFLQISTITIILFTQDYIYFIKYKFGGSQKGVEHGHMGE